MSDNQQSKLGACVSAELIEGVLMTFAQRPFQRGSGYCVTIPPRPGTNFDHLSCEWCEGEGMKDEPLQLYRSIGHHQVFSQASSTAAPDDSFDNPVVGHPTCMIYNTDPDKVASRLVENASVALSWTDASGRYNLRQPRPSSFSPSKWVCAVGGGMYENNSDILPMGIPSKDGLGSSETACKSCATALKRFAETVFKACTQATIERNSDDGKEFATLRGLRIRPERQYNVDVELEWLLHLHDKSHKETAPGPCAVPDCTLGAFSQCSSSDESSDEDGGGS